MNYKIAIVDDEPSILEALNRLLKSYDVHCFSQVDEALQFIQSNPVDIVISDYRMPKQNGLDFLRTVKNHWPSTLRILLSGQVDLENLSLAINENILHRFFVKPWENDILKSQILEAIQQKELINKNLELNTLALTDPVTNLKNHRAFQQDLRACLKDHFNQKSHFSLLMIDVDHFKSFNDRYGHPEGDKTLLAVSNRITELIPDNASLYRYGGEEFCVIIQNTNATEAQGIAEDLRNNFETKPFKGSTGRPHYITISIGLSQYPLHSLQAEDLIQSADRALYQAKRQGRNQTVVALI